ncbi:type I-E CRISPR-associated protein Cse1/CasA [Nocardia cyriacigeorgica]|uniref:type I-E CRISPR-associated protein Cse1/CasA n=1 Tax=Nocardia cyriacigeorgica TaxID=135487 RepID=UPI0013B628B8|nr:type I-E CRISPR-associated protein Cse1/CasA [Nocardia cyriacigeorgica]NEW51648.1 type I-E CRISPR-associated protein Cse1/CasA [Nocardia cyriacigeorgica]
MNTTAMSFDLLEEPWIAVTNQYGTTREVSLREVFRESESIASVAGEVPTQAFAILRLLLAILHRSVHNRAGGPVEVWRDLWSDWPADAIDEYLAEHHSRFDLFDPRAPFLQVADLRSGKDAVSSLDKLIADVPNGSKYFTTRAGRHIQRISPAEAARWLVHVHAFDPSGIKTGAEGDPRVKGGRGYPIGVAWSGGLGGVFLEGVNLRQTLLLNLVLMDLNNERYPSDDLPPWERKPDGARERSSGAPTGPVDLMTWQSRRVRFVRTDSFVTGVVLCNGDALPPFNQHLLEAMTGWRYSEIQSKKANDTRHYPVLHDPDKSLWRGLASLLGDVANTASIAGRSIAPGVVEWASILLYREVLPATQPIRLHATGIQYINNQSVVGDIVDDTIGFSAALLTRDPVLRNCALTAVNIAEKAVDALGTLAADLSVAAGGTPEASRGRAREAGFFELEAPYRTWLRHLRPRSDDYSDEASRWERAVDHIIRRLGAELVADAGQQAWVGREVRDRWVDSARADHWFHLRLSKLLPAGRALDSRTAEGAIADDEIVDVAW